MKGRESEIEEGTERLREGGRKREGEGESEGGRDTGEGGMQGERETGQNS